MPYLLKQRRKPSLTKLCTKPLYTSMQKCLLPLKAYMFTETNQNKRKQNNQPDKYF